jgi:type IV pilus assembly protein PilV
MTPRCSRVLTTSPKPAAGFTLIEILVAVLVLSLGVLGAAGMQVSSLRANKEARSQEVGTRLALELGELIRANHVLAANTTAATNPYLVNFSGSAPNNSTTCFTGSACSSTTDIAKRDMDDWAQRAAAALPGIVVAVCYDAAPFDGTGTPEWACDGNGNTIQIKIGWTRANLNRSTNTQDQASVPAVVLPVTPRGS